MHIGMNTARLIEAVRDELALANEAPDDGAAAENVLMAVSTLLQVVENHEQRIHQAATALILLADSLGYPVNSIPTTRAHLRAIAALLADDTITEEN